MPPGSGATRYLIRLNLYPSARRATRRHPIAVLRRFLRTICAQIAEGAQSARVHWRAATPGPFYDGAMRPIGVHHVSINVSDPGASIDFYTSVLGGRVRDDRPDFGIGGAWIDLGTAQVHLIESQVPPNLGQHFAILYDDLDAVVAELRDRGIDVADPRSVGPNRQTFVDDPDGNAVELHQLGTA